MVLRILQARLIRNPGTPAAAALYACIVGVTAHVPTAWTLSDALGDPILEILPAAAARTLFANAAEAIPARRITSVPALPAITILAPGFVVLGVVAVLRNKVPVVDVQAPEETDSDASMESKRMIGAIQIVGSFCWAPFIVGQGVSEDLQS